MNVHKERKLKMANGNRLTKVTTLRDSIMKLEKIIGGSINSFGRIIGANLKLTELTVNSNGTVCNGGIVVARVDSAGNFRDHYGGLIGIQINPASGLIEHDRRWGE